MLKATESVLQPDGSTATSTATFTYDVLNRLTQEVVDSSVVGQVYTKIYTLDLVGNRTKLVTSKEGLPTETTVSTYNSRDQLLTETTGSTTINYGYDDNGSLITQNGNGSSRTQAWDVRGRLQSTVVDGVLTSYDYTSDGIRSRVSVDGVTTDYIVDSMTPSGYAQVVEELASGVLAVRYTYGASLDPISETRDENTSVYLADGHSGVRQAIGIGFGIGEIRLAQRFDAYGISVDKVGWLNTPIGYRGERFDATLGQYSLRARMYDPRSGRFISMDPYQGNYGDTSQAMRYGYAGANPICGMDPSGMSLLSVSIGSIGGFTLRVGHVAIIGAGVGFIRGFWKSYLASGDFWRAKNVQYGLLEAALFYPISIVAGLGMARPSFGKTLGLETTAVYGYLSADLAVSVAIARGSLSYSEQKSDEFADYYASKVTATKGAERGEKVRTALKDIFRLARQTNIEYYIPGLDGGENCNNYAASLQNSITDYLHANSTSKVALRDIGFRSAGISAIKNSRFSDYFPQHAAVEIRLSVDGQDEAYYVDNGFAAGLAAFPIPSGVFSDAYKEIK